MSAATSTTIYDVVTRYRLQDRATAPLTGIERQGSRTASTLALATRGARMLSLALGGMTIGVGAVTGVRKTFANLNTELNSSLELAAQFNAQIQFSENPLENWGKSLTLSKALMSDLIKDAAKLPGELDDFLQVSKTISGGVLAGGGGRKEIRDITGQLAFVGRMAGTDPVTAGTNAMMALLGTAGVEQPLFRFLVGGKFLPDAKTFNALPSSERLKRFGDVVSRIADDPGLRASFLNTFETQLGTLSDALFGAKGIGGTVFRGAFDDLLASLTSLNNFLEKNGGSIAEALNPRAGLSPERRAELIGHDPRDNADLSGAISWALSYFASSRASEEKDVVGHLSAMNALRRRAKKRGYSPNFDYPDIPENRGDDRSKVWWGSFIGLRSGGTENFDPEITLRDYEAAFKRYRNLAIRKANDPEDDPGEGNPVANNNIVQNFDIKLDLKSDSAPHAVAVQIRKGLARATQAVKVSDGGVSFDDSDPSPLN